MSSPKLVNGRISERGACYVITAVAAQRRPIFLGEIADDAQAILRQIEDDGLTTNIAWVVMPDHVHWLFELRATRLSDPVQRFKSASARQILGRHSVLGKIWQAGYYDHRIRQHEDLVAQAHYIAENPVRAGLIGPGERYPYAWCRYSE